MLGLRLFFVQICIINVDKTGLVFRERGKCLKSLDLGL